MNVRYDTEEVEEDEMEGKRADDENGDTVGEIQVREAGWVSRKRSQR